MRANEALRVFAARLQPASAELAAAQGHFATIKSRLAASFGLPRIVQIGSHARGTAIGIHSDVDILAVLPRDQARWGNGLVRADTYMRTVADDLRDRYTATSIRRDGQAVVLNFRGGEHSVDVVPGIFLRFESARPVYAIPGADGRWIATSPERHNRFFALADGRAGGKLRKVSQLVKAWRFGRDSPIPLSSFYVDMLLASTDLASGIKSYSQCLADFFSALVGRRVRGLQDPEGIAGIISASNGQSGLDRAYSAAIAALEHSEVALAAEARGNHAEARRQWGIVFREDI